MKNLSLYILAVLLVFTACNDTPTQPQINYESEVNVFGLLILNNGQKNIHVERTYKVTDYFPPLQDRAIKDARVLVRSDEQEVEFKHLFDGNYSDAEGKLVLKAGFVYQLEINLKDGRRVTAETIIPSLPEIVSPQKADVVPPFHSLPVSWNPALFCAQYAVTITNMLVDFEFTTYTEETEENLYSFLFAPPGRYVLKVTAMDQNFYDHTRSSPNRNPILHIEGGIGVFGSMAFQSVVFDAR
jgi:hypothetical protein